MVFSKFSKWILLKNFLEKAEVHKTSKMLYYFLGKVRQRSTQIMGNMTNGSNKLPVTYLF